MEYLDDYSTAIRRVARKVATMEGRLVCFGGDTTTGMYFLNEWTWHMTYIDIRVGLFIASMNHVSII